MRFSVGDLVAEKKINHWYFAEGEYGYGYTLAPHYAPAEYWDEYYDRAKNRSPVVGIVMEAKENDLQGYYETEAYMTYRIMWLNTEDDDWMMSRWFYGDELRLLSKTNRVIEPPAEDEDER